MPDTYNDRDLPNWSSRHVLQDCEGNRLQQYLARIFHMAFTAAFHFSSMLTCLNMSHTAAPRLWEKVMAASVLQHEVWVTRELQLQPLRDPWLNYSVWTRFMAINPRAN